MIVHNPFFRVFRREWRRITSRRLYLGVCLVLPLFTLFFMATIFGNGQMEQIPIAVVDQDNTSSSREVVRRISATPTFRVTEHLADESLAREAVQKKEVYGYLVIPPRFEAESSALQYYYHYALMSVGGTLMAAFEQTLASVSLSPIVMQATSLGTDEQLIETFLLPIEADTHPLYNPNLDYSIYLSQPFFFVLLQILVLLVTVYSIGCEVKQGTLARWMNAARGNIFTAVAGKLLPYTLLFCLVSVAANFVFYGRMHIPFSGSLWAMNGLTMLFVLATQCLAVAVFSLFPRMAYIISVVSMLGSLGATLSGVTFPVASMYAPVCWFSHLFPVRHFTEAVQRIVYFSADYSIIWPSVAILLLFPLLAVALLPLLRSWFRQMKKNPSPAEDTPPPGKTFLAVSRTEWHSIATNPAILLVLVGGVFMYGLLYNYMYAPNVVRNIPVAVVDLSHSSLGREYIRLLDATPQASVAVQTPDMPEARRLMKQGKVWGIFYLPADFESRVARGEVSIFSLYAATDAFLGYKGLQEAASGAMLALNERHRNEGVVFLPPGGVVAATYARPIEVVGNLLYNPTEGYGSYLIPAVLIVILFQTMLMLITMLRGEERLRVPTGRNGWYRALQLVAGRTTVYLLLYSLFALFLIGLLPLLFSVPHLGRAGHIACMLLPFLLATSFFGQILGAFFHDAESPLLCIAFFSVGYIFLSGVSYPLELMPWYWQLAHHLFPVTPAILAFVKLNSMGATPADIHPQMLTLWIQTLAYGAAAVAITRREQAMCRKA